MSTHIVGFKPANEKWKTMKAVWDASKAAGINIPQVVLEYFGHVYPDTPGMTVDIKESINELHIDASDIYEVDITKLPKDVTIIRFINSW